MMSKDYRLDPVVRRACKPDINKLCAGPAESLQSTMDKEGSVMGCLKRERESIKRPACRNAIARSIERASRNIRYATSLAAACQSDRASLCPALPKVPGSGSCPHLRRLPCVLLRCCMVQLRAA